MKYDVYVIGGNKVIAANEAQLRIDYRAKITNPDLFTRQFTTAFEYLLASRLAVPTIGLEKGMAAQKQLLQLYTMHIAEASANSENQKYSPVPDSEFITVRN